jgi:DNA-binding IclR family transcriptional regulator
MTIDPDTAGILRYLDDGKAHATRELAAAGGTDNERVRQCMEVAQAAGLVTRDRDDMWTLTEQGKNSIV